MKISPLTHMIGSHKTGELNGVTAKDITAKLGQKPINTGDSKCVNSWAFETPLGVGAIWDYKGSQKEQRFSTFGNPDIFRNMFGSKYSRWPIA